jgi:hypothetical protein
MELLLHLAIWTKGGARQRESIHGLVVVLGEDRERFGERSLDRLLGEVIRRGQRPELLRLKVEEGSDAGFRVPGATGDCFLAALEVGRARGRRGGLGAGHEDDARQPLPGRPDPGKPPRWWVAPRDSEGVNLPAKG